MGWWKWVGLAGVAGVAATGAVMARDQRQRNAYSPEQVRSRLHDRAEDALVRDPEEPEPAPEPNSGQTAG